jgi:hypothetical protein
MHILYVDESGSVTDPNEAFFVLGGVSVFERGIYHQIKEVDDLITSLSLGDPHEIELHGNVIYQDREPPWRSLQRLHREKIIKKALTTLGPGKSAIRLFAVAIDKESVSPRDPIEIAFEEICNRFNLFLAGQNNRAAPTASQRGLIVMDDSKHEKPLQALARHFRINGARWGQFRSLAEVPLFVDSKASRLVQLADLVAYANGENMNIKDDLIPLFDSDGGVIHGLFHYKPWNSTCYCPACYSRAKFTSRVPPELT